MTENTQQQKDVIAEIVDAAIGVENAKCDVEIGELSISFFVSVNYMTMKGRKYVDKKRVATIYLPAQNSMGQLVPVHVSLCSVALISPKEALNITNVQRAAIAVAAAFNK